MLVPDGFTIYFNQEGGGILLGDINTLNDQSPAFEHNSTLGIKASIRFNFRYWQVRKIHMSATCLINHALLIFACTQSIPDAKNHADRRPQVKVRHGRKGPGCLPVSLRTIAERVRSELVAEMVGFAHSLSDRDQHGTLIKS